jgi:hypothetical protein
MARGGISFLGIGAQNVTVKTNSDIKNIVASGNADDVVGLAVTITGNGEAGLGAAGDPLFGQIVHYENDGYMTVQYAGFAEFNGVSGSLPTAGTDFVVVVDGEGAVMASSGATGPSKVISVGEAATGPVVVLIG